MIRTFEKMILIVVLLMSASARAQYFQIDLMKGRQKAKASSRWTLADWLAQKEKISIWDQWLAANSSANIFEMQLASSKMDFEVTSDNGTTETSEKDFTQSYSLDLWVKLLGLRAEYEEWKDTQKSQSAMLNLRLIGSSLQSTNLILRGGMQQLEDLTTDEKWDNLFAAASLRIYFLSFIGLQGEYRHLFPGESDSGTELSGTITRGGAFVEWGILRLTGTMVNEPFEFKSGSTTTERTRSGMEYGVRLIF